MWQKIKNLYHLLEAIIANVYFGFPSRKLIVIGVTGTDGKTTTTHLIHHILTSAGYKAGMVSSISSSGLHTTTPRAWEIQKMLSDAVSLGITHYVLETTSHAIDQNRVWGVHYTVGVLTNVSHEHMYHHKTLTNYVGLKAKLLINSDYAIANNDDESYETVKSILAKNHKIAHTYSLHETADFMWDNAISSAIKGEYNRQNILAAYAVCKQLGVDSKKIIEGIKTYTLPKGRFDIVHNDNFLVIIDFAHTPNSIAQVLKTIQATYIHDGGKIIHVFGAASQRDDTKRPLMGEASGQYAKTVILTEEDHRHESAQAICESIAMGLKKKDFEFVNPVELSQSSNRVYTIITNREEAIKKAISTAQKNDVVMLTGKSHEKSLNRKGKEYPWDEYEAVRSALQAKQTPRVGLES